MASSHLDAGKRKREIEPIEFVHQQDAKMQNAQFDCSYSYILGRLCLRMTSTPTIVPWSDCLQLFVAD